MTPIFLTDKIVKNKSLSALSFQFLLFMMMVDLWAASAQTAMEWDTGERLGW